MLPARAGSGWVRGGTRRDGPAETVGERLFRREHPPGYPRRTVPLPCVRHPVELGPNQGSLIAAV
jgi:hypothetical protein